MTTGKKASSYGSEKPLSLVLLKDEYQQSPGLSHLSRTAYPFAAGMIHMRLKDFPFVG